MTTPIRVPAAVTLAGNVATASFPSPPLGYVWTGSVSVPGATPNSVNPIVWTGSVALAPAATWYNAQASGAIQVASGDTLTIAGTGVAATGGTAYFVGSQDPVSAAPSVWPQPTPAPPPPGPFILANVTSTSPNPVTKQPVIVGTGTNIAIQNIGANPLAVEVEWQASPTGIPVGGQTFDVAAGVTLTGWNVVNTGPLISVVVAGTSPSYDLVVETGTAPIPSGGQATVDGVLAIGIVTVGAGGTQTFALPPFTGEAYVYGQMAATAANVLDLAILGTGLIAAGEIAHFTSQYLTAYGFAQIPPSRVYLPSTTNTLQINNRSASSETVYYSVIAAPTRT